MTRDALRYITSLFILAILMFLVRLLLSSTDVMSETMLEASPVEAPTGDFGTATRRLIEKTNELDEEHIMREKVISELRRLLMPDGYRSLDLGADDVVARLYLIATLHPEVLGDVLSYHERAVSQSYLACLQTVESRIKLNLDYIETSGDLEKVVMQMVSRVLNADLSSEERRNMTKRFHRLLFVLSLQQHARQGVKWKDTYYGKIESKLAVQRQELEQTFESMLGADFESSFASVIILNWPAWSYTLTCGKNYPSLEPSAPQPEQTPSLTPTSPSVVPRTEPNSNVFSPVVEPQPREKKVPTPNAPEKPHRKVPSQEWIQIR
jgi:hypothetical protein